MALTVFEILTFEIYDFENLGEDHELQHLQFSRWMVNINLYKSHDTAFSLALNVFIFSHI